MLIDAYKKGVLHFPSCKHFEDITTVRRFFLAEDAAGRGNMQGQAFASARDRVFDQKSALFLRIVIEQLLFHPDVMLIHMLLQQVYLRGFACPV